MNVSFRAVVRRLIRRNRRCRAVAQGLRITVAAVAIGGLIVPALGQRQDAAESGPHQGMTMDQTGHGRIDRGGMSGGCGGMMQSMHGGDGPPNSQWRSQPSGNAAPG